MMSSKRRLLLAAPLLLVSGAMLAKASKPRLIKIEARKFRFSPNVIELKKGEEVVALVTRKWQAPSSSRPKLDAAHWRCNRVYP